MENMAGRVALVTGASSGIGSATALAFAAKGATVVVAARREDELAALVARIEAGGGTASAMKTDVSVASDVERLVAHTVQTHGGLDFAVNNAGYEGAVASIVDLDEQVWDQVLDTNLKGAFLCMKHEARAMLAGGRGGAIVNVGSVNSFLGCAGAASYVASKHGMVGLTSSASAELAPLGIRVNIVCPGIIDTPMHRRGRALFGDAVYDQMQQQSIHLRRAGQPEEIAKAIVFLCSDDASYITGATLTPDGGYALTM